MLNSAAFLDNNCVATGGNDGILRMLDIRTGQQVLEVHAHPGGLICLSPNPAEFVEVLTGGMDSFSRLWDIRSSKIE